MDASQVVTDAWHVDEQAHVTDFSWWDDLTLIVYAESRASDLLDFEAREIMEAELAKRGLSI